MAKNTSEYIRKIVYLNYGESCDLCAVALMQYQILKTDIKRNVWLSAKRIDVLNLRLKGYELATFRTCD